MDEVIIVGAGIGGLTLGLALHAGRNSLPHFRIRCRNQARSASASICCRMPPRNSPRSGSKQALAQGRDRDHGRDLLQPLRPADLSGAARPRRRLRSSAILDPSRRPADGAARCFPSRAPARDRSLTGQHCIGVEQDEAGVTVTLLRRPGGADRSTVRGRVAIACDGINSAIRKQFFPDEGEPRYSGVNMWRGVTRWKPMLSGASMVRAGWLSHGKMVIYPIRPADADGLQLINWVAEIETPNYRKRDWNRAGSLDDFIGAFADWHFDWLDVPAFIRAADSVLEFPMVDQDPLPRWSFGRVTLLGDAAHPMVPRGSNGAGQAILDARALTAALLRTCRSGRGARGLREAAAGGDHAHRADQPHQSAGCDPARGVSAHQGQAVRGDRGRHQPRGARRRCPKATSGSRAIRRKRCAGDAENTCRSN